MILQVHADNRLIISGMDDEAYMRVALEEARLAGEMGEVPIGAVVVHEPIDPGTRRPLAEPQVIARAGNRRESTKNPAGHAEFAAMLAAARELDAWRLEHCTVYVTLEPCIMCAGLMHQARIRRCVYGAPDPKAGALGSLYRIHEDTRLNHTFEVAPGVLQDECANLLRGFFATRRKGRRAAEQAQRLGREDFDGHDGNGGEGNGSETREHDERKGI